MHDACQALDFVLGWGRFRVGKGGGKSRNGGERMMEERDRWGGSCGCPGRGQISPEEGLCKLPIVPHFSFTIKSENEI